VPSISPPLSESEGENDGDTALPIVYRSLPMT
jgi:hypothetical protein